MDDGYSELGKAWTQIDRLELALKQIAAPPHPNGGGYTLSRAECEELARQALEGLR